MPGGTLLKTPRELFQERIVSVLEARRNFYTAPYGVIPGKHKVHVGGYVRTVTFGIARILDATVWIWTEQRAEIRAAGALAYRFAGSWTDPDALVAFLESGGTTKRPQSEPQPLG